LACCQPSRSGTLGAQFAASGADFDIISQTFATTPGSLYDFTFFYQPISTLPANNHFVAFFDGVNKYDNLNTNSGFITLNFTNLVATGSTTTVLFEARSATGVDYLDNVSVTPSASVPDAGHSALLMSLALAGIVGLHRRLRA
jgi:hypothetical protein